MPTRLTPENPGSENVQGEIQQKLDVFANEPLPADDPLTSLDNVVLTPHIGATTAEAAVLLAKAPVDNIINYLSGEIPNLINPPALEHPRQRG
jgi:phosphoglycerate dehydrogenase-like enzyme